MVLKNFNDLVKELQKEDPAQAMALMMTGKIIAARDRAGLNNAELANKSGVPIQSIIDIEEGRQIGSAEVLAKLYYSLDLF